MKTKLTKNQKLQTPYKATTISNAVKDVDLNARTITGMFNSYFYIDSDLDMLLPNCAAKSISERGANSKKGNKIKHLKDHDWSKNMARIDVLDERAVEYDGKTIQGIYHESYFPEAQDSTDLLIKIQEGIYDSRSIGFNYVTLLLCAADSPNELESKGWEEYYPKALNPEVADQYGYFWAVKEIKLWEGSDVSFGANALTPMLGMKSQNKDAIKTELFTKIDNCQRLLKNGNLSDQGFHSLEMELQQLKSCLSDVMNMKPSVKGTSEQEPPNAPDTSQANKFFKSLINV
jgi:hypothetical protein